MLQENEQNENGLVCPKCKKVFEQGVQFCSNDGTKLVSPEEMIPKCVICETKYEEGIAFCPKDGGRIIPEAHRSKISKKIEILKDKIEDKDFIVKIFLEKIRIFRSIPFVLVILSFFLPFVQISCDDYPLATATGIEFISGNYKIIGEDISDDEIPSRMELILVILLSLGGIIAALLLSGKNNKVKILAGVGFVFMLVEWIGGHIYFSIKLSGKGGGKMSEAIANTLSLDYRYGFFLVLFSFAFVFCIDYAYKRLSALYGDITETEPMKWFLRK